MFCRSKFFFTENASVLKTLSQSGISRLSLGHKRPGLFKKLTTWKGIGTRFYSSEVLRNEVPLTKISKSFSEGGRIVTDKKVSYWLFGTSTLIFGIVVLGGLTRLTESGLSITEWKPVTGVIPPLNEEQWMEEFTKYQQSPEFKQLNSHITLEDFKFIFSMEWGHRLVGRGIGAFFILPALYFWTSKRLSRNVKIRVVGLTGLLGLQGFIGWWMVKSGLDEKQLAERNSKPTVSPYRLTTHLGAAFIMYLGVLWTGFEILRENKWIEGISKDASEVQSVIEKLQNPAILKTRRIATALLCLTFLTAMSGGFVAGLDAGLIYNYFPHMTNQYPFFPKTSELFSPVFSRAKDLSDLWWRNLLENPATVQLVHRTMATATFFAILAVHMHAIKVKHLLPKSAYRMVHVMMGFVTLQVTLGITTLIYLVPISLATLHQAGALALLTSSLAFAAQLKKPRPQMVTYINKLVNNKNMSEKLK